MKKTSIVILSLLFFVPNLTLAETSVQATPESLRAEIDRLTALLSSGIVNTSVTVIPDHSCLDLPYLSLGSSGDSVRKLQLFLRDRVSTNWPVTVLVSGYFGNVTKNSLIALQVTNGIVPSGSALGAGKFGPKTRALVKTITCAPPVATIPSQTSTDTVVDGQTQIPDVVVTPVRLPGLYVSLIPQATTPVYEAGDIGQILGLRFESVGMDLNLKRIGLDFTEGDVVGVQLVDILTSNQSTIGSINLNSKQFYINLSKDLLIESGTYEDLYFSVKVGNTTSLENDFYQLNVDMTTPNNTYALNTVTSEKVYVSNLQKFMNQGAWLLDDKTEAELSITGPYSPQSYTPLGIVNLTWYTSGLLDEEKVKIEILDKAGILGVVVQPSFEIANISSYVWTLPAGFSTNTGTFAIRLSCTIHECDATSINYTIKSSSGY